MMKPSALKAAMAAMLPTWLRWACSGLTVLVGLLLLLVVLLLLLEVLELVVEVVSELLVSELVVSEVVSAELVSDAVVSAVVSAVVCSAVVSSAVVSAAVSVLSSAVSAASASASASESPSSSARLITHGAGVGRVLTVVVAGTWAGAVRGGWHDASRQSVCKVKRRDIFILQGWNYVQDARNIQEVGGRRRRKKRKKKKKWMVGRILTRNVEADTRQFDSNTISTRVGTEYEYFENFGQLKSLLQLYKERIPHSLYRMCLYQMLFAFFDFIDTDSGMHLLRTRKKKNIDRCGWDRHLNARASATIIRWQTTPLSDRLSYFLTFCNR